VGALISPLMDHVKRVELVVVALIEPRADEIGDPKAGPPRQRQGVNHELRNGFFGLEVGWCREARLSTLVDVEGWEVVMERDRNGVLQSFRIKGRDTDLVFVKRRRAR
jgi:hypothetical protein